MYKFVTLSSLLLLLAGCFGTNYHWDAATQAGQFAAQAEAGSLVAQYNMAKAYATGHGVQKDELQARNLYEKLAGMDGKTATGNDKLAIRLAQIDLGAMYKFGIGVQEDERQAKSLLEKGTEDGLFDLSIGKGYGVLGWIYASAIDQDLRNPQKAFECATLANQQRNPAATDLLGNLYEYGIGVQKDYNKSFQLYTEAANAGDTHAKSCVADAYLFGHGVSTDYDRARNIYNDIISQGANSLKLRLALMAYKGLGENKDIAKAKLLIQEATQNNDISFVYGAGMASKYGICEVKERDFGNLILSEACRRGNQKSCSELKK